MPASFATVAHKGKASLLSLDRTRVSFAAMSSANRPTVDVSSRCACAAVTMTLRGPVISMLLCSCLDCQRATGSGHASVALVPDDALTVSGETKSFARAADSGATFTRHFCPNCGTPLHGQSSRAPAMRMIPVGFFAGQNDWFAPNQLIFARSQQAWDLVADHLPRHETYRQGTP
jgi:hypothetical protein